MTIMDLLGKAKKSREKEVRQKVAIGATLGITVGAVAGVLLAPKAGKETRADLAKDLKELPDRVKEMTDKTQNMVGEAKETISERTQEILAEVKEKFAEKKDAIAEDPRFKKAADMAQNQTDTVKDKIK